MESMEKLYNCSKKLGENEEYIGCVYANKSNNMSIYTHVVLDTDVTDDMYLKIFNNWDIKNATKCCRVKLFKSMYKKTDDDFLEEYLLNDKEKQTLVNILNDSNSAMFGHLEEGDTLWANIIKDFICFRNHHDKKSRKLLLKALHKMPDYTKLEP